MRPYKRVVSLVSVVALLLTVFASFVSFNVKAADEADFEKGKCPFTAPSGWTDGKNLICGMLTVPEDHSKPDGKTLKIAVAVLKTRNPKPEPDPVIYLQGGPGGYLLDHIDSYSQDFESILNKRDVIFFDQRGVGYSEPALNCPNLLDMYYKRLVENKSDQVELAETVREEQKCYQKLLKQGVNFAAYNTVQNAADVDALRQALGYEKVNLYGISYGTRLALTVMRDFPDSVRSAVLDSVVPLEADFTADFPMTLDRSFKALFNSCAENPLCNKTYPDLEKVFYELVDQLNAKPAIVNAKNPLTGKAYDVVVDGDFLIGTLFRSMYIGIFVPDLPSKIYQAKSGNYKPLVEQQMLIAAYSEDFSTGMYYAVNCNEEVPFYSTATYKTNLKDKSKQLKEYTDDSTDWDLAMCKVWKVPKADATENEAVKSDIPALVMSGEYDPITPPQYSKQVADSLSHSYYYNVINGGHGPSLDSTCALGVVEAFLNTPTEKPNDKCLASMQSPLFTVPLTALKTSMVEFSSEKLGISGLSPEDWVQTEDGVFSALGKNNLTIRLVYRVRTDGVQAYLDFFRETNKIKNMPKPVDTIKANKLEWTIYKVNSGSAVFDLATTEVNGTGYIVVLISPSSPVSAHDTLFTEVFEKAVKALKTS